MRQQEVAEWKANPVIHPEFIVKMLSNAFVVAAPR
jgi:hypothetical protein